MDKKKRVTSYDVAREAGVSQSVVSRVFLKGRSVSKKSRDKVLKTANKLGYRPNAIARSLITQTSGIIAVIISTRASLNYPELLSLVNKRLAERNKRLLLFTLDNEYEVDDLLEQIWTYQIDGVIALAAHFDPNSFQQFKEHHVPIVLYNRKVDGVVASSVCCNHEQNIRLLIELLLKKGHEDFLVVSGPSDSDVGTERRELALKTLQQHGFNDVPVLFGDFTYESGQQVFDTHMKSGKYATAIISGNDSMALGIIDQARYRFNLGVPEDLSVVGFDGIGASSWKSFQLTTVKQPIERMTQAAVDMLLEQIDDPERLAETRIWAGNLIEGHSIGEVRKKK